MARKFKKGDRVRVRNKWAMFTAAKVEIGEIGTVLRCIENGRHCDVDMDDDPVGATIPWSIPSRGLELIKLKAKGER